VRFVLRIRNKILMMKLNLRGLSVGILFVVCVLNGIGQSENQVLYADYIIRHVNVVTMRDENVLKNQVVIIAKDRISFIGPDNVMKVYKTRGMVIQANEQYLMPGLADMHCHFPDTSEFKKYFTLNLMAGVTTLRSMRGQDEVLPFKGAVKYPSPNLILSGIVYKQMNLKNESIDSLVNKYKSDGMNFIKIFSIADTTQFSLLIKSAKKHQLPVCGHYLSNIGMDKLLNSGYKSIEHLGGQDALLDLGPTVFNKVIKETKAKNLTHCPTLDWYQTVYYQLSSDELKQRAGLEFIADTTKQRWEKELTEVNQKMGAVELEKSKADYKKLQEKQFKILKQYADSNVRIIIGLDAGGSYSVPGFVMIEEMKLFQRAGLSNFQILKTATINAATYLNQQGNWGTVEVGKIANLILLKTNPITNLNAIKKVNGVFLKSKYYNAADLKKNLN